MPKSSMQVSMPGARTLSALSPAHHDPTPLALLRCWTCPPKPTRTTPPRAWSCPATAPTCAPWHWRRTTRSFSQLPPLLSSCGTRAPGSAWPPWTAATASACYSHLGTNSRCWEPRYDIVHPAYGRRGSVGIGVGEDGVVETCRRLSLWTRVGWGCATGCKEGFAFCGAGVVGGERLAAASLGLQQVAHVHAVHEGLDARTRAVPVCTPRWWCGFRNEATATGVCPAAPHPAAATCGGRGRRMTGGSVATQHTCFTRFLRCPIRAVPYARVRC